LDLERIKHSLYFLSPFFKAKERLTQTHSLEGWQLWPCSWLYHTSGNRENQTQSLLPFPLFLKKRGSD
jgi:hypothetical protein